LDLYNEKSRWGITSGNKTPVSDRGTGGHSVFAYHFIKTLQKNTKPYLSTQEIYIRIAPIIRNNSEQTPLCRPIRNTGDQGGEFIFIVSSGADFDKKAGKAHLSIESNVADVSINESENDVDSDNKKLSSEELSFELRKLHGETDRFGLWVYVSKWVDVEPMFGGTSKVKLRVAIKKLGAAMQDGIVLGFVYDKTGNIDDSEVLKARRNIELAATNLKRYVNVASSGGYVNRLEDRLLDSDELVFYYKTFERLAGGDIRTGASTPYTSFFTKYSKWIMGILVVLFLLAMALSGPLEKDKF
jgi:hypothetical protein